MKSQAHLNRHHARWVEFLETFHYTVVHKKGAENVITDALSRCYALLTHVQTKVLGFALIKDLYPPDAFFGPLYAQCLITREFETYFISEGYLYKAGRLCIPTSSIHLLLIREAHDGRGHFGSPKTLAALKEHFFWPHMAHQVTR